MGIVARAAKAVGVEIVHKSEVGGKQQLLDSHIYVRPEARLDEARPRSSLAQLALGVMALHGSHIIHRDLKPSNVIVNGDGRVLVLDFGLVLEMEMHSLLKSADQFAGTPAYMAP